MCSMYYDNITWLLFGEWCSVTTIPCRILITKFKCYNIYALHRCLMFLVETVVSNILMPAPVCILTPFLDCSKLAMKLKQLTISYKEVTVSFSVQRSVLMLRYCRLHKEQPSHCWLWDKQPCGSVSVLESTGLVCLFLWSKHVVNKQNN